MASNDCDVFNMVKKFQQLQEERVHVYHLFNEGHKIYLGTAPNYEFVRFRQLVHEITQQFKRISEEIIGIENRIRKECGNDRIADRISKIQEVEKIKLELTAQFQLAKQVAVDYSGEPEREIAVIEIKQRLNTVIEKLNDYLNEVRHELVDL